MASTPSSNPTVDGGDRCCSPKTVSLKDWWLIKVPNNGGEGERLGVAGVDCRGPLGPRRVISSAPIAKRFDCFSVETEDGRWVLIKGYLNKERTTENGFPSEVVRSFQFGFPPDWEECVSKFFGRDSARTSDVSESSPDSDEVALDPGERSIPTSVHFDQEETPLERSSELCRNFAVDDLPKRAVEETDTVDIESSNCQSIGRPKHRGGNQKKPLSTCCATQKATTSSPAFDIIESLGGVSGATAQSAGRVSRRKPRFYRGKRRAKQRAGSGLNSKRTIGDSDPAIFRTVGVTKNLDFGCVEDDLLPVCNAEQGQNVGGKDNVAKKKAH